MQEVPTLQMTGLSRKGANYQPKCSHRNLFFKLPNKEKSMKKEENLLLKSSIIWSQFKINKINVYVKHFFRAAKSNPLTVILKAKKMFIIDFFKATRFFFHGYVDY